MDFRKYIRDNKISDQKRILEFGPLNWPIVSKNDNPNIYFADIRSTEEIIKLYESNDYLKSTGVVIDTDRVVDIDFIIKGSYKDTFKKEKKFDIIYLSHVIEHIPDIINFFCDIENIINKNGELVLIYPDVRYCFDHFRNGTSFIDAYEVFHNKDNQSRQVFDFVNNVVHENSPSFFWDEPDQNRLIPKNLFKESERIYNNTRSGIVPNDVHFWPFADFQFIKFLYDMDRAGLLGFDIKEFYPTQENTQEFMVILSLKKDKHINYKKYQEIFDEINPSMKELRFRASISELAKKSEQLLTKNQLLAKEISEIYSSKRWRFISKLITIKNKILGIRNDK